MSEQSTLSSIPPEFFSGPSHATSRPRDAALPVFRELTATHEPSCDLERLRDVELDVRIELGKAKMRLEEVMKLGDGAVVELDRLAGDPVDVLVNDRLVARGQVVVVDDKFAVRLTEVLSPEKGEPT